MDIHEQEPVVAFTLAHYPPHNSFKALAHLALDRWPLAQTPGLRFWRLLGVGQGRAFDPHPDFQRYALFTVWDSLAQLRRFEVHSRVMRRIHQQADETWTVHMLPVRWHGQWGGRDPLHAIEPVAPPDPGPWVILTRATIQPTKLAAFLGAVPVVAEQLLHQDELMNSVGVGEAPLLFQATLSLWRTLPAITAFAYGSSPHLGVVRRTRREQWYSEELFARFRPIASFGTWGKVNPLSDLG